MENLLIAIALVTGAVAVGMCAIVLKMAREERRRTNARIEALVALASESPEDSVEPAQPAPLHRSSPAIHAASAPRPSQHRFDIEILEPDLGSADLRLGEALSRGDPELFARTDSPSPWPRRIAAAAALAAVLVVGALVLGMHHDGTMDTAATAKAAAAAVPLELLSLTHRAEPGLLTISGLVQNPSGGTAVRNAVAVAFLFTHDGGLLASARVPLDYTRLEPGNSSPFVLTVPVKGTIARYRVGFRGPDGAVIAHVDRRTDGPIARK